MNRKEISQFSINKQVTADDEWLAEAYLDTDYSNISIESIIKPFLQYEAFKMENGYEK